VRQRSQGQTILSPFTAVVQLTVFPPCRQLKVAAGQQSSLQVTSVVVPKLSRMVYAPSLGDDTMTNPVAPGLKSVLVPSWTSISPLKLCDCSFRQMLSSISPGHTESFWESVALGSKIVPLRAGWEHIATARAGSSSALMRTIEVLVYMSFFMSCSPRSGANWGY